MADFGNREQLESAVRINGKSGRGRFVCEFLLLAVTNFSSTHVLSADMSQKNLDSAVLDSARPATDTARDADRRPVETLAFVGVQAGDKMADYAAGAGLKFDAESTILKNAADPHTADVFDPSIRGKTDRFILKFGRPR